MFRAAALQSPQMARLLIPGQRYREVRMIWSRNSSNLWLRFQGKVWGSPWSANLLARVSQTSKHQRIIDQLKQMRAMFKSILMAGSFHFHSYRGNTTKTHMLTPRTRVNGNKIWWAIQAISAQQIAKIIGWRRMSRIQCTLTRTLRSFSHHQVPSTCLRARCKRLNPTTAPNSIMYQICSRFATQRRKTFSRCGSTPWWR